MNHSLMDLPNQVIATQVRVGEHPSSMAGHDEIIIDVQYLPSEQDAQGVGGAVRREVEEHIAKIGQLDLWLAKRPPRIEWILDADSAEVAVDGLIVQTFATACTAARQPFQLWGMGAHTDVGIPTELGKTPTINFGPGDPSQAHQPNENVSVIDLVNCTKVIALGSLTGVNKNHANQSTVSRRKLGECFHSLQRIRFLFIDLLCHWRRLFD